MLIVLRFLFGGDENVLKFNCGNDCTILYTRNQWLVHFKWVKSQYVNYISIVIYKKKSRIKGKYLTEKKKHSLHIHWHNGFTNSSLRSNKWEYSSKHIMTTNMKPWQGSSSKVPQQFPPPQYFYQYMKILIQYMARPKWHNQPKCHIP